MELSSLQDVSASLAELRAQHKYREASSGEISQSEACMAHRCRETCLILSLFPNEFWLPGLFRNELWRGGWQRPFGDWSDLFCKFALWHNVLRSFSLQTKMSSTALVCMLSCQSQHLCVSMLES